LVDKKLFKGLLPPENEGFPDRFKEAIGRVISYVEKQG